MWELLVLLLLLIILWPGGETVYIRIVREDHTADNLERKVMILGLGILGLVVLWIILTSIGNPPPPLATS
jgi:hypothetical protein